MAEQAELEQVGCVEREAERPQGEQAPTVRCVYCGDFMSRGQLPRFNRTFGVGLLVLGLAIAAFMSLVVGLPLVVLGAYMGSSSRSVWVCRLCAAMVDRDDK